MIYSISSPVDRSWDICSAFSHFQLLFSTRLLGIFLVHSFKDQPRIWGKCVCGVGNSFPLVLSFSGFPPSIYSSSGSPNSVLWHLNLIKQQISAWIIAPLRYMKWELPSGKSQISVDLTQWPFILSKVEIFHDCCLPLDILKVPSTWFINYFLIIICKRVTLIYKLLIFTTVWTHFSFQRHLSIAFQHWKFLWIWIQVNFIPFRS